MKRKETLETTTTPQKTSRLKTIAITGSALLLMLLTLCGAPFVQNAQAHPSTFPDIAETDPAHEAIEALAARGVIRGFADGRFRPNALVTRAQAAKMLVSWRAAAVSGPGSSFSDVDAIYAAYVDAAFAAGWVTGYPDGTFRPRASLSRQQTAIVVIRSLGVEVAATDLTDQQIEAALAPFSDRGLVSDAARPYVALALTRGLLAGDGDRLDPALPVTRAQLSLVLHRASIPDQGSVETDSGVVGGAVAEAQEEQALAAFMDTYLFQPHRSPVTGAMVLQNADWYGIPPLAQLVIMAAETSLGDPELGGALARSNNFGCLRYHGSDTPWGQLSDGRIWVAGKDWYSFPTPAIGMAAWGRYLKSAMDGFYLPLLSAERPLWEEFAAVYYGRGVSGFASYVNRLRSIESRFREMASERGVSL